MPDRGYENYCFADPLFYDAPEITRGDDVDFDRASTPLPDGWQRADFDDWLVCASPEGPHPKQGWKIHVSTTLDEAEAVLGTVWDYCVPRGISFKFVRSRQLLFLRDSKSADRSSSGKFVTIFPVDDQQCELILNELGDLLAGKPGPYILSDLRWGEGPLYVRYGGFAERYCLGSDGQLELAIESPDGELIPDRREPTFSLPPWLTLPSFLEPHLEARRHTTVQDVPYQFESALHFSNGGGVYAAVDTRSGERVVLKEGRPHAGLDLSGSDAVARLQREASNLQQLQGLDVVPAVRDTFTLAGHYFIALEYVEGTPLRELMAERLPLVREEPDETALAEFVAWATEVMDRVDEAVAAIHARGLVLRDLHPFNVLVRPDGRIVLIDLEVAAPVAEAERQALADPHFLVPAGVSGFDIDRYALACMRLFMFLPLTALIPLAPGKAEELAHAIEEAYPVVPGFLGDAVRTITDAWRATGRDPYPRGGRTAELEPGPEGWLRARDSMARAIVASATPERKDRLFPGDVKLFLTDGLNLAYGAAGVLYALAESGAGQHEELEDWLVRRATSPEPGVRLGFYDGLHGVAYALECLGRREDALKVLDICRHEGSKALDRLGSDLLSGLAGIGLNLAHFARLTEDTLLLDEARGIGAMLADRLGDVGDQEISGGDHPYAGLTRGCSGSALLFLRLHEDTGDSGYLDLAETALEKDLLRCVVDDVDGSLEVNEGWRTMPYLADGTIGIGLVIEEYLAHRANDRFATALHRIDGAALGRFYVEPGLFYGRAGMLAYLAGRGRPSDDPAIEGHVRRLNWHALSYEGHLAFPGEELMRLSMDLATGNAGVLLGLGSAIGDRPVHLPLIGLPHERNTAGQPSRPTEPTPEGR